jgi:hypothetical protein
LKVRHQSLPTGHCSSAVTFAKLKVVPEPLTTEPSSKDVATASSVTDSLSSRLKLLNWSGIFFALLQSACTAVIAISGVRVVIGLSAVAAAAGIHAPARGFHQDAIRIPMMLLALAGSLVNLFVNWRARKLRTKPASQWRQKPVSSNKLNSERFQITLSILTLVLLAAEWITHPMIHRVP